MNANQKKRMLRNAAIVATALVAAPWWSTTVWAQSSQSDKLINWNDYPVKNPAGFLFGDNGIAIGGDGTSQRCPGQGNRGTPPNRCSLNNNGNGYPAPNPIPPIGNGNNCPDGGTTIIPPWFGTPPTQPPSCPPGYQGKPPGCTPPGFGKPPGCTPPGFGKPPGSGKPPGEQQTPTPPTPPVPPPGCQWDKSQGRTPGGGDQSGIIISWVGQVQVNGNTLRVEFKKSGNIWIESWNGVPLFQHQELSFTGGIAVLYDAVRQIHVQLNSNTAAFSGPTGSGQLSGGFQAIG